MKLDRRVAIVTGAAAGIGAATARLFSKEGARLVLVDLNAELLAQLTEDLEAASTIVLDISGDVSEPTLARTIIERTMNQFGRLDVLFNKAGIVANGTLVDCTEAEWERTMAVNLKSMYYLCRSTVPVMQNQGGGSIINMSSIAGSAGVVNRGAYSVSKAGVIGLTKSLAMDFVKDGIRVNCICPGDVDTPMLPEDARLRDLKWADYLAGCANRPLGRIGTAAEIAKAVLFLASDDSSFMTGAALVVDGGGTAD